MSEASDPSFSTTEVLIASVRRVSGMALAGR